jgi:DNA segregation ATPase FtsK/SpoIIIE-like protein
MVGLPSMNDDETKLYAEAAALVKSIEHPSVSALQRKLKIGYAHSMRLVNEMVGKGDWPVKVERGRRAQR